MHFFVRFLWIRNSVFYWEACALVLQVAQKMRSDLIIILICVLGVVSYKYLMNRDFFPVMFNLLETGFAALVASVYLVLWTVYDKSMKCLNFCGSVMKNVQEWTIWFAGRIVDTVRSCWFSMVHFCKSVKNWVCRSVCDRRFIEDRIILTTGSHEIEIHRPGLHIDRVWIDMEECMGVPVCHGQVDKVGVHLSHSFFILYADIFSNIRTVRWRAVLK